MIARFLSRNVLLLLLSAALLMASVSWYAARTANARELSELAERSAALEQRQRVSEDAQTVDTDQNVADALGLSRARVARDSTAVRDLVGTMFTWDSGESYEVARNDVLRNFGLPEDGDFMTEFFPKADFNVAAADPAQRYYYIDAVGINSSLNELVVRPYRVRGTDYTYLAEAEVRVTVDNVPNGSASRTSLIYVTLNDAGEIIDIEGHTSTEPTRTSD